MWLSLAGAFRVGFYAVIDLKLLRESPDAVRRSQTSRGEDLALVDTLLAADTARRSAISTADSLRADQKAASKKVGAASADERRALLQRAKELAEQVKAAEAEQAEAEAALTAAHMEISNVIIDGVPAGGGGDYTALDLGGGPGGGAAVLLPDRSRGVPAAGALAAGDPAGGRQRFHPGHPAGAGASGGDVGHRFSWRARRGGVAGGGRRPLSRRHLRG